MQSAQLDMTGELQQARRPESKIGQAGGSRTKTDRTDHAVTRLLPKACQVPGWVRYARTFRGGCRRTVTPLSWATALQPTARLLRPCATSADKKKPSATPAQSSDRSTSSAIPISPKSVISLPRPSPLIPLCHREAVLHKIVAYVVGTLAGVCAGWVTSTDVV